MNPDMSDSAYFERLKTLSDVDLIDILQNVNKIEYPERFIAIHQECTRRGLIDFEISPDELRMTQAEKIEHELIVKKKWSLVAAIVFVILLVLMFLIKSFRHSLIG